MTLLVDSCKLPQTRAEDSALFQILAATAGPESIVAWDRDVALRVEENNLVAFALHDGDGGVGCGQFRNTVRVYFCYRDASEPKLVAGAVYLRAALRWFFAFGTTTRGPTLALSDAIEMDRQR